EGTRFLSHLVLRWGEGRPLLLSSSVREDNLLLSVDLTNPDIHHDGKIVLPRGTVHIYRTKFLRDTACYERLRIWNYGLKQVSISFALELEADYFDIFEVRGLKRERRGERLESRIEDGSLVLAYEGLDRVLRQTRIETSPPPDEVTDSELRYALTL